MLANEKAERLACLQASGIVGLLQGFARRVRLPLRQAGPQKHLNKRIALFERDHLFRRCNLLTSVRLQIRALGRGRRGGRDGRECDGSLNLRHAYRRIVIAGAIAHHPDRRGDNNRKPCGTEHK